MPPFRTYPVCSYALYVDLYLRDGGVIGMVLPHSALQTGQYTPSGALGKWQSKQKGGRAQPFRLTLHLVGGVRLQAIAWDLEGLGTQHVLSHACQQWSFARRLDSGVA